MKKRQNNFLSGEIENLSSKKPKTKINVKDEKKTKIDLFENK